MVFVAGHFGEWVQGRHGRDGSVALITLACPRRGLRAERLGDGSFALDGSPIPEEVAARFLTVLGAPVEGQYRLTPDFPPGGGAGMSTAALVALGRLNGAEDGAIARACLATEGASDPLMWPAPDGLLWASRRAEVLGRIGPVPACEIVGGFRGLPERTDPRDMAFPDISDLVADWPAADLAGKARLASASAERCTALRGPTGDPTPSLAARLGALGHARAHTGPARALIFAPGTVPEGAENVLTEAGFTGVLRFTTGGAA